MISNQALCDELSDGVLALKNKRINEVFKSFYREIDCIVSKLI